MRRITVKFTIKTWCAWQPGSGDLAWCLSYANGKALSCELEKPQLSNIPPMQKRRLSKLARVVFHVLDFCEELDEQGPIIFSSVMGEIQRTQGILHSIATDSPVSPASFSLSVHNSISGLWSILHGNHAPMMALSPPSGSPVGALAEAAGILAEGRYSAVTVVFYEERYPAFYDPFLTGPEAPRALAVRMVACDESDSSSISLKLQPAANHKAVNGDEPSSSMLDLLREQRDSIFIEEPQMTWCLERVK